MIANRWAVPGGRFSLGFDVVELGEKIISVHAAMISCRDFRETIGSQRQRWLESGAVSIVRLILGTHRVTSKDWINQGLHSAEILFLGDGKADGWTGKVVEIELSCGGFVSRLVGKR